MDFEPSPEAAELLRQDPDRYSSLSHQQWLFLVYGDSGGDDCPYLNAADAEASWTIFRALLLKSYWGSGKRPIAWWCIEHAELPWKGPDRQQSTLFEHNLLTERERVELTSQWRKAFDAAQHLDSVAQRKAFVEADIPKSLLKQWQRERRRRGGPAAEPEAIVGQSPPAA